MSGPSSQSAEKAAPAELPDAAVILRVEVGPSDVIVVQCQDRLGAEGAKRISAILRDVWPGRKVMVLDGGMTLRVIAEKATTEQ